MKKEKSSKSVAVVIANWNGKKVLEKCLKSLQKQTFSDFDVYVVDNGSEDDSCQMVEENFPKVVLIKLSRNTGFAKANNIGFRQAIKKQAQFLKYICPLNNDIELAENYLEELVRSAQKYQQKENKNFGILAAKLLFFYERDRITPLEQLFFLMAVEWREVFGKKIRANMKKRLKFLGAVERLFCITLKCSRPFLSKTKKAKNVFLMKTFLLTMKIWILISVLVWLALEPFMFPRQ